jgi:hypothetical protein
VKQTKITKSAKGKDCQVRVMGICNGNNETTVFAHLNGGGMGRKHSDLHGAYACSDCHAWLDGEYVKDSTREQRDYEHLQGVIRTQSILLAEGLVKLA